VDVLFQEERMRKLTAVAVAMILAIALYFTLSWGYDAFRILTSPNYGLDDVWRSQFIFAIGSQFHLGPVGLLKLAAFFGTLKLAVAGICAVHIFDRCRALTGSEVDTGILEGGLILIVLISIASVGTAVSSQNAALLREHAIQLMLAAVAAALCLVERNRGRADVNVLPAVSTELAATPRGSPWFAPFR
jgi:hypothetical protein